VFHTLVLLACTGRARDVLAELQRREGVSGVAEKASRNRSRWKHRASASQTGFYPCRARS